jgi:hypothetical protein
MQQFLIGPGIGGAKLTKAALEYIICRHRRRDNLTFEMSPYTKPNGETEDYVWVYYPDSDRCECEPLYTEWWNIYKKFYKTEFKDVPSDGMISLPFMGVSDIRDLIVMYLVLDPYNPFIPKDVAEKMDKLNGGYELRVVEVPDGYQCLITDDQDYGTESVQECARIWNADIDADGFTKQQIKNFAYIESLSATTDRFPDTITVDGATTVGEPIIFKDLVIAKKGERAVVYSKLNDKVAFLKKAEYFRDTLDHPSKWFEIVGEVTNKFQTNTLFHDISELYDYYDLVKVVGKYRKEKTEVANESGNT